MPSAASWCATAEGSGLEKEEEERLARDRGHRLTELPCRSSAFLLQPCVLSGFGGGRNSVGVVTGGTLPRVGRRGDQPWAGRRNPVGIRPWCLERLSGGRESACGCAVPPERVNAELQTPAGGRFGWEYRPRTAWVGARVRFVPPDHVNEALPPGAEGGLEPGPPEDCSEPTFA